MGAIALYDSVVTGSVSDFIGWYIVPSLWVDNDRSGIPEWGRIVSVSDTVITVVSNKRSGLIEIERRFMDVYLADMSFYLATAEQLGDRAF